MKRAVRMIGLACVMALALAPMAWADEPTTREVATTQAAEESAGWWLEQALVHLQKSDDMHSHVIKPYDPMDITFDTILNAMIGAGEFERALKIAKEHATERVAAIEAAMKSAGEKPKTDKRDYANEPEENTADFKRLRELWKEPKGREAYEKRVQELVEKAKKIAPIIDIIGRDHSERNLVLDRISRWQQELGDFEGAYKTLEWIGNTDPRQEAGKEKRAYQVECKTREFLYTGRMKELKQWVGELFSGQDKARACLIVAEELARKRK